MLFYFTATGNSLYAAKKLDENPISIPQTLRSGNLHCADKSIGIVCPIYAGDAPGIVMDFLRKAKFETEYFYIIMTYGNDHTDAAECTARFAGELGIRVDYMKTVKMADNYLPVFDMDEQKAMEKNADEQINDIIKEIAAKTKGIPKSTEQGREMHARVSAMFKENPGFNNGESITVKEGCNGCGVCAKVCPVGNISVEDGKAKRRKNACNLFCLACVQNCPQKALGLMMDRNPNARYRHEKVSLQEIAAANNQNI